MVRIVDKQFAVFMVGLDRAEYCDTYEEAEIVARKFVQTVAKEALITERRAIVRRVPPPPLEVIVTRV